MFTADTCLLSRCLSMGIHIIILSLHLLLNRSYVRFLTGIPTKNFINFSSLPWVSFPISSNPLWLLHSRSIQIIPQFIKLVTAQFSSDSIYVLPLKTKGSLLCLLLSWISEFLKNRYCTFKLLISKYLVYQIINFEVLWGIQLVTLKLLFGT
jgi:hypothetical protein